MEKGYSKLTSYLFRYLEDGKEEELDIYTREAQEREYLSIETEEQIHKVTDNILEADFTIDPKIINGDLYLSSLTTLDGAILPEQFNKIYLANNVVVTPENVHEYGNNNGRSK